MFCFVVGCNSDFEQHQDGVARVCPRCNNASIVGGAKKTYLEFCFIPLSFLPISKKQIWICPVCNWHLDKDRGEPQRVGAPMNTGGYQQQPGYGWGAGKPPQGHYPGPGR
ncbi:hypothetical protein CPB86DRAFT_807127 [Serendipita vermifera]|nr:hypothetical protein CPB86DRAFT_807127 [Serendipita vermifera]